MKCLSVAQPFANLITSGKKIIELRNWNTHFRGEFLVHAPQKMRKDDAIRLQLDEKFVKGAIIGKAEIFDVKVYENEIECKKDHKLHFAANNYTKYGFMLKNAKSFRVPIPWKGKLGFFEVDLQDEISKSEIVSDIIDEEYRYQWIGHH